MKVTTEIRKNGREWVKSVYVDGDYAGRVYVTYLTGNSGKAFTVNLQSGLSVVDVLAPGNIKLASIRKRVQSRAQSDAWSRSIIMEKKFIELIVNSHLKTKQEKK